MKFFQQWALFPVWQNSDGRGLLRLCQLKAGSNDALVGRNHYHNLTNKRALKRFCCQFGEYENPLRATIHVPVWLPIAIRLVQSPTLTIEEHINSIFKPFPTCQAYFWVTCHLYSWQDVHLWQFIVTAWRENTTLNMGSSIFNSEVNNSIFKLICEGKVCKSSLSCCFYKDYEF